jgi:hypothetical protein
MMRALILAGLTLTAGFAARPASACAIHTPLDIRSIRGADLVVTGRILNYRLGPGESARFDLAVDAVLRGRTRRNLAVRIEPTMSGAPGSMPRGRVLVALRAPGSATGRNLGASVLQSNCSDPFILDAGSARATAARRLLGR